MHIQYKNKRQFRFRKSQMNKSELLVLKTNASRKIFKHLSFKMIKQIICFPLQINKKKSLNNNTFLKIFS